MSLTYRLKRTEINKPRANEGRMPGMMTCPFGKTLQTFDPGGIMKSYGICKTGSLGALVCEGVH
jgi:hypothetical protein